MGNIPADYGLINMESGAKEWLVDSYEEEYHPEFDWKAIYRKSGYDVGLEVGLRMNAAEMFQYRNYDLATNHVEKDSLGRMKFFRYIDVDENGQPLEVGSILNAYHYQLQEKIKDYKRRFNKDYNDMRYSLAEKIAYDEIIYLIKKTKQQPFTKTLDNPNRVVKGGTWQQPSSNRVAMRQDSTAVDVGFRCVLPYTGLPVRKGYKVRW